MFGRAELKYFVSHEQKTALADFWRGYLTAAPFTDEFAGYPIRSCYFDSPTLRFFEQKVDGEAVRNKVRVRGYCYQWPNAKDCFIEVKRKLNDRLFKFRKNLGAFRSEFLDPAGWQLERHPEVSQAGLLTELYHLRPSVETFYRREAWESPYCHRLRITFDSDLIALHPGQMLSREMLLEPQFRCFEDTRCILEIKANEGLPGWIADGINAFGLVRRSISKYVICAEKLNLPNWATGVYA
jgi:hypothetical protein